MEVVEEVFPAVPKTTTVHPTTARALWTASEAEAEDRGDKVLVVEGPRTRIYDSWVWVPAIGGPRGREMAAELACLFYSFRVKIQARLECCTDAWLPWVADAGPPSILAVHWLFSRETSATARPLVLAAPRDCRCVSRMLLRSLYSTNNATNPQWHPTITYFTRYSYHNNQLQRLLLRLL